MATPRTLINVPAAQPGEAIEIRATIAHAMETGLRPDDEGKVVPRDIVTRFECRLDGALVFAADLFPAVAANPLRCLHTARRKVGQPGVFVGRRQRLQAQRDRGAQGDMKGAVLQRLGCALSAFGLIGCVSNVGTVNNVAAPGADTRQTGFNDMSPALQAMQLDDTVNPAMLWVREDEALWSQVPATGQSCASCHSTNSSTSTSTSTSTSASTFIRTPARSGLAQRFADAPDRGCAV